MLRIMHLKWIISLLIPAGAYFIVQAAVQADPSLNPHLPMFFAITLWAITVWATDILPAVPSAAAMTFLYLLCTVAPPVIFGAWGAFLPWICFGALVLSEALETTGLTRRLALQLMHLVGATFTRIVVSLMVVGMFMAFLLPDIMRRVIIFVAIAHGLVLALELDPKSRISSAIIMAGFCAATSPGYGFLTGTEMSSYSMISPAFSRRLPYRYGDVPYRHGSDQAHHHCPHLGRIRAGQPALYRAVLLLFRLHVREDHPRQGAYPA